ncbi:MAG: hypothetical protein ACREVG_12720, partial [Burkholderiales bacterium]
FLQLVGCNAHIHSHRRHDLTDRGITEQPTRLEFVVNLGRSRLSGLSSKLWLLSEQGEGEKD